MENYESDIFMSQEGYASIDFTLLDRPNNNIASAPEATAALLPDVHVADSSYSFDFLDGSGVDGLSGFPRAVDENALEQSRNDSEKEMYKERSMHPGADNEVADTDSQYGQYQMPQAVQKPVSNVDFFAKKQALQQQEQQSQLSLFGNDGAEDSQDYFESGQVSQQSQPAGNWWTDNNLWIANNQREQQVYNGATATEDQRRLMQMKVGSSQTNSQAEYPGAMYSMPQAVSSEPAPSMYSFLPTNTSQPHKMGQAADAGLNLSRVQSIQNPVNVKNVSRNSPYDFDGLLNGSGYQQGGNLAHSSTLSEQHRYRGVNQEPSSRDQQLRMQGQQNQNLSKYEGQNMMEVSPLKVSDYEFLGGDYLIKGQPQTDIGQLEEGDAQMWRQQQQQQASRQQSHQLNPYASNSLEELHQRQQAQVRQRLQQQLYAGNQGQSQTSGNQFQAFLSESSLQDIPRVMQQHPDRNAHPIGMEGHHPLLQSSFQAVNQNNPGNLMYPSNNDPSSGQGQAIGYLLGQDNSFSWQQLAMKASGLDQSLYGPASNNGKRDLVGQQMNPYANVHGNAMQGFFGGMGKLPAANAQVNRPIPRSLGAGSSSLFGPEGRSDEIGNQEKLHASRAKMLFGQNMRQPQALNKNVEGFSGSLRQNSYPSPSQQSVEESQSRHQQSMRGNEGTPQVKLFAQSLTSLDPIQHQHQHQHQHQQQQQNLLAANSNAQRQQSRPLSGIQQSSVNMLQQARNQNLGAGHYYFKQGVSQAGGSFLQNANDAGKQRHMWSGYELEPDASQVDVPMVLPGNADPMQKSNNWPVQDEAQARAENERSFMFGRSRNQQSTWGGHGVQQNSSQSSGDLDSRHRGLQHASSQQTSGQAMGNQPNGGSLHQNSETRSSLLSLAELGNGRQQQELQNARHESSWREHSLLQASPQQSTATNSSLQAFTDLDSRGQTSWKSLWQSVNSGNSQLAEGEKEQQDSLWGKTGSHVAGSQARVANDPNAATVGQQSGWSDAQGTTQTEQMMPSAEREQQQQHLHRDPQQQQYLLSGSSQAHGFQAVDARSPQLSNQTMGHASQVLSDNDPGSAEHSYQNEGEFGHGNQNSNQNPAEPVAASSGSRESLHLSNLSAENQASLNRANMQQQQGRGSGWSALVSTTDSAQGLDGAAVPTQLDSGDLRQQHSDGRVQLQLSNHQAENRFSPLISAKMAGSFQGDPPAGQPLRAAFAIASYRHQNDMDRPTLPNGATEDSMAAWAQGQMAAGQMRIEQSKLGGRAFQTSNSAVTAGKEYFTHPRSETNMEGHPSFTDNMVTQNARYQGTQGASFNTGRFGDDKDSRDAAEPGNLSRNTLELLSRPEQEDKGTEGLEDQEAGTTMDDGGTSSGISLAHLRRGTMSTLLQRPTPSRPESATREQLQLQLSRNMEVWPQGRQLAQDYREDPRAYAQAQMVHSIRAAQLQNEATPSKQAQMQERMNMNAVFLSANRHLPVDISRQAAHIYKNLSTAAKYQFAHELAQQSSRANPTAQPLDPSNMSSFVDPRSSAQQQFQQHLSRAGYAERASIPAGPSLDKPAAVAPTGKIGQAYGYSQEQPGAIQLKQAAPVTPIPKKRKKEYPPLIPWRTTITQAASILPTMGRSEMDWAAASNCIPDQDRVNDGVESLDITAMCIKRARRRLKFTTQLMQQIIPALPCQLFKGCTLDDHKSAAFVLAKFAVSEVCWLATGAGKDGRDDPAAVPRQDAEAYSNGNHTSEPQEQQLALVTQSSPDTLANKLRIQLEQQMTQFQDELLRYRDDPILAAYSFWKPSSRISDTLTSHRLESSPTALKLSRDLHDLDKLGIVTRLAKVHGTGILAGLPNSSGSPRGRQDATFEASHLYNPPMAYSERYVAAISFPRQLPEGFMLIPL